jgi:DNA-binding GntR family transcriptional regulator
MSNDRANVDQLVPLIPATRKALSDDVTDRLREAILQGCFVAGEYLREEKLAAALDVSRGPVREALLQLEREGLVLRRPNRGTVVAELSRRDLEEVYSLRSALEALAVRWAAQNASEDDLERLEAAAAQFGEVLVPDVAVQQAARVDIEFHDLVYEAAYHERLARSWSELRPQVHLFLLSRRYVGSPGFRDVMVDSHRAIVEALRSLDPERAALLAEDHVRTSYLRVVESYEERLPDDSGDHPQSAELAPEPLARARYGQPAGES